MKGRENGMPEEDYWQSFFTDAVVKTLFEAAEVTGDLLEFGCGYGPLRCPLRAVRAGWSLP